MTGYNDDDVRYDDSEEDALVNDNDVQSDGSDEDASANDDNDNGVQSEGSADDASVDEPTETEKLAFVEEIMHKLDTVERKYTVDDSDIDHTKYVHKGDLKTVLTLLVHTGLIPYLSSEEYTSDFHEQIGYFLEEFFDASGDHVKYHEADGCVYDLRLSPLGMGYNTDPNYFQDEPLYEEEDVEIVNIHKDITKLVKLRKLTLSGGRVRIPQELEQMKSLKHIVTDNVMLEPGEEEPPELPAMVMDSLKSLVIDSNGEGDWTAWLSRSKFPALEELDVDNLDLNVFNALEDNSLFQLRTLTARGIEFEGAIDNLLRLLLQILPQHAPCVRRISFFAHYVHHGNTQVLIPKLLSRIAEELKEGNYHHSFLTTLSLNLESFAIRNHYGPFDNGSWQQPLVQLLPYFKRLSSLPWLEEKIGDGASLELPYELQIQYMLLLNFAGGRLFIPGMETRCSHVGKDVVPILELSQPPQVIPLGLWPRLIERSNLGPLGIEDEEIKWPLKSDYTATFRMLRPNSDSLGPVLERVLEIGGCNINPKKRKAKD